MTKDCRQASDVGQVPKRSDCRVEYFPSVVLTGLKYDSKRLINKGAAGPITDLGQDVETEDPFLQIV